MKQATLPGDSLVEESGFATVKRGLQLTPGMTQGLALTLTLAVVASAGRIVIPVAMQRVIDGGQVTTGTPNFGYIVQATIIAVAVLAATTAAQITTNRRLFRSADTGLAQLRIAAFKRVHELSLLTQNTEQRGSLVSRVTADVDQVANFISMGGLSMMVALLQVFIATLIMLWYSWPLAIVMWCIFLPMIFVMRKIQLRVRAAFVVERETTGQMLGTTSEVLVGAQTVRAYNYGDAMRTKLLQRIDQVRLAQRRIMRTNALNFSLSELTEGVALASIITAGIVLGTTTSFLPSLTLGQLVAFIFLVTLFVTPIRLAIEQLSDAQNAVAGWRRVLGLLATPADVPDPENGVRLPAGPLDISVRDLCFAYPGGPQVMHSVSLDIEAGSKIAIVGETGSGKTTFAKLLTRLMDPSAGEIVIGGVPLTRATFDSLRRRVMMVPQDGFLFDTTLAENVRYGAPSASDVDIERAFAELGLSDWVAKFPQGLDSQVGQRGESLSAGERQLVAMARAYIADPDVLVLDEATSAVDPSLDVALQHAIAGLSRGRTTVTIAHRLSTAEVADSIVVFDSGRLVEQGPHASLVSSGGIYAGLHASWVAQRGH
ncbi:ABC transporter ATP-binding protein [Micrococcales bacterium 31B]|nr:ABC transporter ATP-binding protein [Micrococcales bacterium 31B]